MPAGQPQHAMIQAGDLPQLIHDCPVWMDMMCPNLTIPNMYGLHANNEPKCAVPGSYVLVDAQMPHSYIIFPGFTSWYVLLRTLHVGSFWVGPQNMIASTIHEKHHVASVRAFSSQLGFPGTLMIFHFFKWPWPSLSQTN